MIRLFSFKRSSFINNFLVIFSSNFLLLLVGFASSIILTKLLSRETFGYYSSINYYILFFVSICELGIKQSTIFFHGKKIYSLSDLFSVNLIIWFISSLLGFLSFTFLTTFKGLDIDKETLILCFLYISLIIFNTFSDGLLFSIGKIKIVSKLQVLNSIIKILCFFVFVFFFKLGLLGVLLSIVVALLIVCLNKLPIIFSHSKNYSLRIHTTTIKNVLKKGFFYSSSLFLSANQKTIPIIVMTGVVSYESVGIYSIAMVFTTLLNKLYGSFSPLIFIKSSKSKNRSKDSDDIHKLLRVVITFLIVVCIFSVFILDNIITLFYGINYKDSTTIALILFVGVVFYNVFLILNMNISGNGDNKTALVILIPVTILNLCLNNLVVKDYDIIGCAIVTASSQIIISISFVLLYSKKTGNKISDILKPRFNDYNFLNFLFR